jgi:hypothetical protein
MRWAGNNYFAAHMRNLTLMSLALDAADDPDGRLRSYLKPATGAWLYMIDHLMRTDAAGGLFPEGFEYSPQTVSYVVQALLALKTAGEDDAGKWGNQVVLASNPFWEQVIPAFLHSQSPATVVNDSWVGQVYQPAWYGAGQYYWTADFIPLFGALGLHDRIMGNASRLNAVRWVQKHIPPGGPAGLIDRAEDDNAYRNSILYFLTFEPGVAEPTDPRANLSLNWSAAGTGKLFARTDWGTNASWFTYGIGWNTIDHQTADANNVELYRKGEWLTKRRVGYDLDYAGSHNHNTLLVENDKPDRSDHRAYLADQGSQYLYSGGDGTLLAKSLTANYVYALGDATETYNSSHEDTYDVKHVSRSIVWLKPDHTVIYDRAETGKANRFKRFNLMLPAVATVSGNVASMTTPKGQKLHVTSLLPAGAAMTSTLVPNEPSGTPASAEPMKARLRIEAVGGPAKTRFLTVLQGADAGTAATAVSAVKSTAGATFDGAVVGTNAVLFPSDLASVQTMTYAVPASVTAQYVTGLAPNAGYTVSKRAEGGTTTVTITAGGASKADAGGVLVF